MLIFFSNTIARLRDERGGVLVMFALLVPTLLLAFAIATDVGNWFVHRRHLQMQVDAAALAGGALFGNCFSADSGIASGANTAIENEAGKYAGLSSSPYNIQVGGGSSNVTVAYNSQTYPGGGAGGPAADDTETNAPCQTPDLMFDVKETERHVPYFLAGVLSDAGLLPEVQIHARARVQLKKIQTLTGMLPLAVPDINPAHVAVTFVNEVTNTTLGTYPLTKGAPANGLNMWSGSAGVTIPMVPAAPAAGNTGELIGMRVSIGGVNGTCGAGVSSGTGFVCFDATNLNSGLVGVRDYPTSTGTLTAPVIKAVWGVSRAACSLGNSSPFFSDATLAGATSCPMDLFVDVSAGASYKNGTLTATINGVTRTMVAPATATGDWTSPGAQPFSIPASAGPFSVDLNWNCSSGCPKKGTTFTGVQRVYSGDDSDSGPVKTIDVSEAGVRNYSAAAGPHTFSVTVGLKGSLNLSTSAQTVALRLKSGSVTTAVQCDGTTGSASLWESSIENGCQTPYQINASDVCPDPSPPSGPADCIRTANGTMASSASKALNIRYAACPANNWPDYTDGDPRIIQLMTTDFSALNAAGNTLVPVQDFAAFYITGWDGASCNNNQTWPFGGSSSQGDIWGHFIKYVAPDPNAVATSVCDPNGLTPCIPVLVK
jgi:hypothetical protein